MAEGERAGTSALEEENDGTRLIFLTEKLPRGFVGWVPAIDETFRLKMFMANVSQQIIEDSYLSFMGNISLNCIVLQPKRTDELLKDTFFTKNTTFSSYFNHDHFIPKQIFTEYTLLDLLNFAPRSKFDEVFESDKAKRIRSDHQDQLLNNFIASYKGYQSGILGSQEEPSFMTEEKDIGVMIKRSLAFGPGLVSTFREVGVFSKAGKSAPHGYIDFMLFSEDRQPTFIAVVREMFDSVNMRNQRVKVARLSSTSTKTKDAYDTPGADRQCIVEVLAVSEVLKAFDENLKFVVLFKACNSHFCLYIYFPLHDLLIQTASIALLKSTGPEMMGFFAYYMMINHHFNMFFPDYLSTNHCGWKEAVNLAGGDIYLHCLEPQKIPKKREKLDMPSVARKAIKVKGFSEPLWP